MKTTEKTEMLD